jgi:hypothetical protein
MKRVVLTKYGFIRFPEEDFHDDGNNFTCYKFANEESHVSKLVDDGQAYLSIHVTGKLPYEVYSTLPHYKRATWDFNGISVASLTDALLQDFYVSCVEYEREYRAAEAAIQYPSLEELTEKAYKVVGKKILELQKLEALVAKHVVNAAMVFSEWEWKRVRDCIQHLNSEIVRFDPTTYPSQIYKTETSFRFIKPDYEMGDSYWFTSIKEVFDKHELV